MEIPRRRTPAAAAGGPPELEHLGPDDLTVLATDVGPSPMNMAAILLVDDADDGTTTVPDAFALRAGAVPRLRQVLVRDERGVGWAEDGGATPSAHLAVVPLPGGGERAVLDEAARLLTTPLDPARPLWAARWLTGWDRSGARRGALVVVLHHTIVDGVGGLEVLHALADEVPGGSGGTGADAERPRATAPRPTGPRAWWAGLRELGLGIEMPRLASRTSLNRPTGRDRTLAAVAVPLAGFRGGAHRLGGTVNDATVAAVVGALTTVLAARGEHPASLVVSVPVSGRAPGDRRAGNQTGVLPVAVPSGLDLAGRVRHVARATARRKAGLRGRSSLPLGGAFRVLARAGCFRHFVEHQRLVHTFETNIRGPARRLRIAGHDVSAVVPAATNPGNVGASFAVLSYAGELLVTVVTDPALVPRPAELAGALADELAAVAGRAARVW